MKLRNACMVVSSLALAAACGTTNTATDAGGGSDSGEAVDASSVVDVGRPDTGSAAPIHNCVESAFVDLRTAPADGRTIMVPGGTNTFDRPCITISAGQSVMFTWNFTPHPLAGGIAPGHPGTGTTPTPIQAQTTGMLYTVAFPSAGTYPFYCTNHFHSGMMGVVRVVP